MKEAVIMNVGCMLSGSIAISVACYVTKSALPLLGFLLIPKWNYSHENEEDDEDEK